MLVRNILFLIISCIFISCSRNNKRVELSIPPSNTIQVRVLEHLATNNLKNYNNTDAIILFQNAINRTDIHDTSSMARLHINLGACFFNINASRKSINNLKYGINLYENVEISSLKGSDFNFIYGGTLLLSNCYRILSLYDSSLYYLERFEEQLEKNFTTHINEKGDEIQAEINTWKALIYYDQGRFEESIAHNIKAIRILKKRDVSECIISKNYALLGSIFMYNGDYIKAENYHKKAAMIIHDCHGDSSLLYSEQITELGLVYFEAMRYNEALYSFELTQKILKKHLSPTDIQFAFSFNNLADAYCGLNQYTKGISYYNQALRLFMDQEYLDEVCVVYHNLGIVHFSMGDFVMSEKYYKKSLALAVTVRPNKDIFTSYTHSRLGQLYLEQHFYEKAITHYQNAILELSIFCEDSSSEINYLQKHVLSKTELFKCWYYKGYCELRAFSHNNDQMYLLESIESFQKALQLQDVIRKQYNNEKTMLSLNKFSSSLIGYYLNSLLNHSKKSQINYNVDNEILITIERNKYTALRSLLHATDSIIHSSVPSNLIICLDTLYDRIRYYDNIISNNNSFVGQDSICQALENKLFENTYSLDTLINYLKQVYPEFNKNQYSFSYCSIKEIQDLLPDSTGIIEYYFRDSILVIFSINKNSYQIFHSVYNYDLIGRKNKLLKSILFSNTTEFIQLAEFFYSELIEPVYQVIKNEKNLIIIPDLYFTDLPFEVLINRKKSSSNFSTQKQDYLVKHYNVSYYFSLNLWGDNIKTQNNSKNEIWEKEFSGFAPLANNRKNHHAPVVLSHSQSEVCNIANIFSQHGKRSAIYIDENSTESAIINELQRSRIVHIASHSYTNCDTKDYHILANTNKSPLEQNKYDENSFRISSDDGKLHLFEIYNLDIKTDLLTLSVCSSGSGENNVGEGITSLAHGFYYSGANNILYTLWDVTDTHTKMFMTTFYSYISLGYSYSTALRKAKLDFINSNYSLPIFWSGYLLNG